MNKILVDGDNIVLDEKTKEITVNGNSSIYMLDSKEDTNLNIIINDASTLNFYDFNLHNKKSNIKVTHKNNSIFNYFHTFKIDGEYSLNYEAVMTGNKGVNNIFISGISKGIINIKANGIINNNCKDNEVNENIKILTRDGKAYVSPMLEVNVLDCLANHNTAISNINEDELFYLMSKGISEDKAIKLIEDATLYGIYKDEVFLNMIKNGGGTFE